MAISYVASNTVNQSFVTGWTINKPTGTADGDVMVATLVYGGTTTTCTPPAGWTETKRTTFGTRVMVTYQKVASSEGASYTFTLSTAADGAHAISSFRGCDTTTPVYAVGNASYTSTTDIVGPTVTTTQNDDWLIFVAGDNNSNTLGVPAGMTMRAETWAATPFCRAWQASEPITTAGATGTRTATTGGASVDSSAHMFALKGLGSTSCGITNRGKYLLGLAGLRNTAPVTTQFYIALCSSTTTPTVDTNTLSELTEVAAGNGYTSGGVAVERSSVGFDTVSEDDSGDLASFKIKDISWTFSGTFPASGNPARWAVLITDEGTIGNRQVIAWWGLGPDRTFSAGKVFTLIDLELRLTTT